MCVINAMASKALLLSIALALPLVCKADAINVYVCSNGSLGVKEMVAKDVANYRELIVSGNAYWADGRLDVPTATAMFEGAGIWQFAHPVDIFAKLPTKTSSKILAGIAVTESGRNGWPWPWTINWNGKSFFYESKDQAVAAARKILGSGQQLFDVGLMQVNWHFHKSKFSSIEEAFEPIKNVFVADSIVQEQLLQGGSVIEAVGRYHSKTPTRKMGYVSRVMSNIDEFSSTPIKRRPLPSC